MNEIKSIRFDQNELNMLNSIIEKTNLGYNNNLKIESYSEMIKLVLNELYDDIFNRSLINKMEDIIDKNSIEALNIAIYKIKNDLNFSTKIDIVNDHLKSVIDDFSIQNINQKIKTLLENKTNDINYKEIPVTKKEVF